MPSVWYTEQMMLATRENRKLPALPFFLLVGTIHLGLLFLHHMESEDLGFSEHGIQLKLISAQVAQQAQKMVPETISQMVAPAQKVEAKSVDAVVQEKQTSESVAAQEAVQQVADDGVYTEDLLKRYYAYVRAMVEKHQFYPKIAEELNQTGKVYVSFTVSSSGHIIKVRVAKSSGYKRLDEAAIALIESLSGKLPFPPELKEASLDISQPINYNL